MPDGHEGKDDEREARPGEPGRQRDAERGRGELEDAARLLEPLLSSDPDESEDRVGRPVLGIEDPHKDRGRRDERGHVGEVVESPVKAARAHLLEQEVREHERDGHLERHREDHVGERRG